MKRFVWAAAALITLLGLAGCDLLGTTTTTNGGTTSNLSDWKVKGSFGAGWTDVKQFTKNEGDPNQLTYAIEGLYALEYAFVLVNPAGTEFKFAGITAAGDVELSAVGDNGDIGFTAAKSSYTLSVDVTDPALPVVSLIEGPDATLPANNAVLLSKLKIKGNQFNAIGGSSVGAWVSTEGTVVGNTESWDVTVSDYSGEFGFDVLEGFVAHVDIDASVLASTGDAATTAVELLSGGGNGGNSHLLLTTKDSNVYTVSVTVDSTKTIGTGRYMMTAKLKTLSTTAWVFAPWDTVVINGNWDGDTWLESQAATEASDVWTYDLTAQKTTVSFKPGKTNWNDSTNNVVEGEDSLTLGGINSGNLTFDATAGHSYRITVDFTGSFTSDNKPVVSVTDITP